MLTGTELFNMVLVSSAVRSNSLFIVTEFVLSGTGSKYKFTGDTQKNFNKSLNLAKLKKRSNKKAFQSNANHLLADSTGCKVNKFEHVGGPLQ